MREHLDIGRAFSAIFDLYKNNAAPLLGSALIIFLGTAVLVALLLVVSPIFVLLSLPVLIAAQFWYQGMVIELVNRVHAGSGVPGIGELFSAVGPRIGRLIVAGILAGLGIAVGLILLIAPGLYLMTIWAVIAPVIVIENAAIGAAFGRSRQLVQGDGWQVFGIVVIIAIASAIVGFIIRAITGRASSASCWARCCPTCCSHRSELWPPRSSTSSCGGSRRARPSRGTGAGRHAGSGPVRGAAARLRPAARLRRSSPGYGRSSPVTASRPYPPPPPAAPSSQPPPPAPTP